MADELGGWSEEGEGRARKRPGWPVDPHRLQSALWRGRYWLFGAALLGAVLGFLIAKLAMPNDYATTAVLKYEGDTQIAGVETPARYALEPAAQALERESFLRKVRDELGMDINLLALANAIEYDLDIRAGALYLRVYADTAEGAAEFARLVTDVFLRYHSERQARRIEQEIARISTRIEGAEKEAEEARRRYNEFRERHGIAHLSTEQEAMVGSAAQLRADSDLALSEIRALEAQVSSLEQQLASIPKTSIVSTGTAPERAAYNMLRQELASARASLSEDHPRVQALEQQVDQLRSQLRGGGSSSSLVGSNTTYTTVEGQLRDSKAQLTTLRERQKGLSQLADKAQGRIEAFSGVEGEASALLAEVEVNEALISRLNGTEAALEDALEDPPSGFSVLDSGTVPELPVRNPMKLVVFLSISILSLLAALAYVLRREFRGLRVQTPTEVAFWGNGPVLGATAWPIDPLGLDELVAGLDDYALDAQGTLLIVGGTNTDAPLASELTRRMNNDWFPEQPTPDLQAVREVSSSTGGTPIQTPPPSGPYPIGGSSRPSAAAAQSSTALALRPVVKLARRENELQLQAWDGPFEGQALRRAARLADRVMVLVRSGALTPLALNEVRRRVGRDTGVGYLVIALSDEFRALPDRCGNVAEFWEA